MSSIARIESPLAAWDTELAGAVDDPAARWRSLEACRDYLRLVVRRGGWSKRSDDPNTSDLIQNTILEGWRGFERFGGRSPGQLRAWLRAILVHSLLKSRRRPATVRLQRPGAAQQIVGTTTSPSKAAQRNDSRSDLDTALAVLSERHRAVIHLRIWDQLSFCKSAPG